MSPCISEMGFGYPKAAPCVFIKFKKNLNWAPEFFEREQLNETGLDYQSIEEDFLKNHPEFVVSKDNIVRLLSSFVVFL